MTGGGSADFAHAACLHMVVCTSDDKLLIGKRSPKTKTYGGWWSVSAEESLHPKDFTNGRSGAALAWGQRLLGEELGLDTDAYRNDDLRILSVFLESGYPGICLCGFAQLRYSKSELDSRLRERRGDIEFSDWEFLRLDRRLLLHEILKPTKHYHPTSQYRLLLTYLKCFGRPTNSELRQFM